MTPTDITDTTALATVAEIEKNENCGIITSSQLKPLILVRAHSN